MQKQSCCVQCGPELSIWDLGSQQTTPLLGKVECHRRAITGFDWSNHQEHVLATASFDSDSMVYLWDLRDSGAPNKFHALRSPFGGASAVKWSRREEHLIAASNGTQLLVWDIRKEAAPIVVIPADLKPLVDFDWSYRDDLQVLTCAPGSIKFWNLSSPRKAIGSIQTSCVRARFNPFSTSCVTLTGQADHSWDLWNLSDISSPYLVKDYGVDDFEGALKTIGPLSKFNWRRVLVGSAFEYQLVTWSTKSQLFNMWRIGATELQACGAEPSKINRTETAKRAGASSAPLLHVDNASSPSHSNPLRLHDSASSDSLVDYRASNNNPYSSGSEAAPGSAGRLWDLASVDSSDSESPYRTISDPTSPPGSLKFSVTSHSGPSASSSPTTAPSALSYASGASSSSNNSGPGSFKRGMMSGNGSNSSPNSGASSSSGPGSFRTTHASRPISFDLELDQLARHPLAGLTREKYDKAQRLVIFSLRHGKTHVETRITFPTMYPHGAPPSFTVVTNTSAASTMKVKEILVTTAVDLVSSNRNCLAPTFSKLIEYMMTIESEVTEVSSIETSAKDAEEALTRRIRGLSINASSSSSPSSSSTNTHTSHTSVPSLHLSPAHSASAPSTSPRPHHPQNASGEFTEYVVKPTDSLAAIAMFFNMTVGELRRLNKIQHSVQLLPGQLLLVQKLPPPAPSPAPQNISYTPTTNLLHANSASNAPSGIDIGARPKSGLIPNARATISHPEPTSPSKPSSLSPSPTSWTSGVPRVPSNANVVAGGAKKGHVHAKTTGGQVDGPAALTSLATPLSMLTSLPGSPATRGVAIPSHGKMSGSNSDDFLVSPSPANVGSYLGGGSPSGLKSRAKLFEMQGVGAPVKEEPIGVVAMRCKFVDRSTNPPQLVEGLITATPSNFFFEPDLEQTVVQQVGALHYSFYLEMKKIREAADLKSMNTSLLSAEDGDGGAGAYLQILTKDRNATNHSKVLLFLAQSQAKAEEVSQMMTRWIASESEKRLVDGLGLDVKAPMTVASVAAASATSSANSLSASTASLSTPMALLDMPTRSNTRHAVGDIIESSASIRASTGIAMGGQGNSNSSSSMLVGSLRSSQLLIGTPSNRSLTPSPLMMDPSNRPNATTPTMRAAEASRYLGQPPARPAPIIPLFGNTSSTQSSPSVPHQNEQNAKSGSGSGASSGGSIFGSGARSTNQLTIPKSMPNEDPDDLPQLLGSGTLLPIEVVWAMRGHLPNRFKYHDWKLIFSTAMHGTSLLTYYKALEDKEPTLLVIRDTDGHIFGGFASQAWHISKHFFGTGESFLFSIHPTFAIYNWTGADDYYCIGKRDFLAMGGGGTSGRYGLWLDSELSAGTSEVCKTFLNRRLSLNEEFNCSLVEVYHIVPK